MAKPISINGVHYKTQKAAKERVREILYRVELNTDLTGEDYVIVADVFAHHPEAGIKAPNGITGIFVREVWTLGNRTRCFFIRKPDGSESDFSFLFAIEGRKSSLHTEIAKACRAAVHDQICAFKSKASEKGWFTCEISGEPILPDDAHCDHVAPRTFDYLVRQWLRDRRERGLPELTFDDLTNCAEVRTQTEFVDDAIRKDFSEFHRNNCELRILHRRTHLTLKRAA